MRYRDFGKTGIKISALGFGAMRLPMIDIEGKLKIDEDKSIGMIHRAFELGVNYIDTAYMYCEHQSENIVGKALKGWRDKVYLSTKLPLDRVKEPDDFRRILEEQLGKLNEDYIDFYHFHGLSKDAFEKFVKKHNLLKEAQKAKDEGLIKHLSFSFHDKPEAMKELVDTGALESVLVQYNLLDRSNEDAIAYAKEKGLGVVIMGPVGGGRLGVPSEEIQGLIPGGVKTSAEIALKFVLSNPNVDCILSGMSNIQMVEENAHVVSNSNTLSDEDLERVNQAMEENKRLAELYCTGCNYCMPCPNEVNISHIFRVMNYHNVYKITDYAQQEYENIGKSIWIQGKKAHECIECGICEEKCPQKIEIMKQLKEAVKVFGTD